MKNSFLRVCCILLALVMVLSACGAPLDDVSETEETEATVTESDTSNDVYIERPDKETASS